MSDQAESTSATTVIFDLSKELSADELESFKAAADANGSDLTNHFLNITIRKDEPKPTLPPVYPN
jgi:hypothetical protein